MILGKPELPRRAKHALAFNPAHFGELYFERLIGRFTRQLGAYERNRHLHSDGYVWSATNNRQGLDQTGVDTAQGQAIRVGMFARFKYPADNDTGERRCKRVALLHLKAGHRQQVDEFFCRQIRINQRPQPFF